MFFLLLLQKYILQFSRVKIIIKSVIFNVHVFEHIYRLMTLTLS